MDGIIHQGFLTKSPPQATPFRNVLGITIMKWKERYFVLKVSNDGRPILEYFTDRTLTKSKGYIDLTDCIQVDAGIQMKLAKKLYQHIFDIRTQEKILYLVASSEADMNSWVDAICNLCGLKMYQEPAMDSHQDQYLSHLSSSLTSVSISSPNLNTLQNESQPRKNGPYIHISDCYSGKPWDTLSTHNSRPQIGVTQYAELGPSSKYPVDYNRSVNNNELNYSKAYNSLQPISIPPPINRELKPQRRSKELDVSVPLQLPSSVDTSYYGNSSMTDTYGTHSSSKKKKPAKLPDVQYLDLDLDSDSKESASPRSPDCNTNSVNATFPPGPLPLAPPPPTQASGANYTNQPIATTVYKTVDFIKTKAFNEMRNVRNHSKTNSFS